MDKGPANVKNAVETISKILEGVTAVNSKISKAAFLMEKAIKESHKVSRDAELIREQSSIIHSSMSELRLAMEEISVSVSAVNDALQDDAGDAENMAQMAKNLEETSSAIGNALAWFKTE